MPFLLSLLLVPLFAQAGTDPAPLDPLDQDWELVQSQRRKSANTQSEISLKIAAADAKLQQLQSEQQALDALIQAREANTLKITSEIDAGLQELDTKDRIFSRKAAFYRCVRKDLEGDQVADVDACLRLHPGRFSPEQREQFAGWSGLVSKTDREISEEIEIIKRRSNGELTEKQRQERYLQFERNIDGRLIEQEVILKRQLDDRTLVRNKPEYLACNAGTPTINLEEATPYPGANFKGPFHGIPRDNQDGIGSCYANTAKNLLVGLSDGKDVASFLDIALQYKGEAEVIRDGLDGGHSCTALHKLKNVGYCPQRFAPYETGEPNTFIEGLMGVERGSVYMEQEMVSRLQQFLEGQSTFQKRDALLSERIQSQARTVIETIQRDPRITLPLPLVHHRIPQEWKLEALRSRIKSETPPNPLISDFNSTFEAAYQNFMPRYIRGAINGQSAEKIFAEFKAAMAPFLAKFPVTDTQLKEWERDFVMSYNYERQDKQAPQRLKASIEFLKELSGEAHTPLDQFLGSCTAASTGLFDFANTFGELLRTIRDFRASPDALLDEQGRFRSPVELMQLVVAPSCLNSSNRVPITIPFTCTSGYDFIGNLRKSGKPQEDQIRIFRERNLASLLQGYPLGNSHQGHINTIVGMRFSPTANRCEYLIRESQTGTSYWKAESEIYSVIGGLTEVRK